MGCFKSKLEEPEAEDKSYRHHHEESPSTSYHKRPSTSKSSREKLKGKTSVSRKRQIPKIILTPPSTEDLAFSDNQTK